MSEFEAEIARIEKLFTNLSVSGNAVVTGTLNVKGGSTLQGTTVISNCSATVLSVGGTQATWKSGTFVTDVWLNTSSHWFVTTISWTNNSFERDRITYGTSVGCSTSTINYLGR